LKPDHKTAIRKVTGGKLSIGRREKKGELKGRI